MTKDEPRRGGTIMELTDHYFTSDGKSLCGIFDSKRGGARRNSLNRKKLEEAIQRGGGRPLCFGCEKARGK